MINNRAQDVADDFYTNVNECVRISEHLPEPVDMEYLKTQKEFGHLKEEVISDINVLLASLSKEEVSSLVQNESFLFEFPEEVQTFIEKNYAEIDDILRCKKDPKQSTQSLNPLNVKKSAVKKPQESFVKKISNENLPFQCRIKTKPNAIIPLDRLNHSFDGSILDVSFNPYEYEIREWQKNPPSWLFSSEKKELSRPLSVLKQLSSSDLHWIDTLDKLQRVIQLLKKEKAIAVDLENHSFRSFKGFVCLMQISTRENDYLIDTLVLREELKRLLDVFTDPSIIKVFHGSDYDVKWLQRDFDLYLVGLFDTGQASRVLGYQSASLSYALSSLCGVNVNKAYQLADWRLRPLTAEMINYARQDTRYLLDVFEMQRQSLLVKGKLREVLKKCCEIASTVYQNPLRFEDSAHDFVLKKNLGINGEPLKVFIQIYNWREKMGRELDESPGYILSNTLLVKLSRNPPVSLTEMQNVISYPDSFVEYNTLPSKLLDCINAIEVNKLFLNPEVKPTKKVRLQPELEEDEDWADVTNFNFATFSENSNSLGKLLIERNQTSPFTTLASAMKAQEGLEKVVLTLDDSINVSRMLSANTVTSMTEIFRVSNKNRKRNKENKRKNHRMKVQESYPMLSSRTGLRITNEAVKVLAERERKTSDTKVDNVQNFVSIMNWMGSNREERVPKERTRKNPSPIASFQFKPRRVSQIPSVGTYQEGEHFLRQSSQGRRPLSSSLYEPYNVHPFKTYKNTTRASLASPSPLSPKSRGRQSAFKSQSYSDNAFDGQSFFERENNLQTFTGRLENHYNDFGYDPSLHNQTLLPQYGNAFGESEPSPTGGLDHYPSPGSGSNYLSSMALRHSNERMVASFDHRYKEALPKRYNIDDVNSMLDERSDDITSYSYF